MVVVRGGGDGELFLIDKEFPSCKMKKALDVVGGDGGPEM